MLAVAVCCLGAGSLLCPKGMLLLQAWSLWVSLHSPKSRAPLGDCEHGVPQGDVLSPAQDELLVRLLWILTLTNSPQCTSNPELGNVGPVLVGNVSF